MIPFRSAMILEFKIKRSAIECRLSWNQSKEELFRAEAFPCCLVSREALLFIKKPLRKFTNPLEALSQHLLKTFSHNTLQILLRVRLLEDKSLRFFWNCNNEFRANTDNLCV